MFSFVKPSIIAFNGKKLKTSEKGEIRPVARVKGGKLKNKIVYFYPNFVLNEYLNVKEYRLNNINKLQNNNNSNTYNITYSNNKSTPFFTKLDLKDGVLEQIPFGKERDCLYICGPSGSGKSYKVMEYCKWYNNLKLPNIMNNKTKTIYLISPKEDDKNINSIKNLAPIELDEENFVDEDTKMTVEDLANSLVIFDDIEAISNIKIRNGVRDLRDNILLLGRSSSVYCVITNHLVMDYKNTRVPLLESQFYTYFPGSGANRGNINYFTNYCGFDKQMINRLLNVRSRSATIHIHNPQYLLTKDELEFLN